MAKIDPQPLTVGELADLILKPGGDRNAVIARIRHWTREGLLKTTGNQRPGTGRPRNYESNFTPYTAALLNVLADQGLQVSFMHTILAEVIKFHRSAVVDGWLEIARFPDGGQAVFLHDLPRPIKRWEGPEDDAYPIVLNKDAEVCIVLNLAEIHTNVNLNFRRLGLIKPTL